MAVTNNIISESKILVEPSKQVCLFDKEENLVNLIKEKKKETLNNIFFDSKFEKNLINNDKHEPINILSHNNKINISNTPITNSFETGFNIVNNKFDSLNTCNYSDLVSSYESTISSGRVSE